MDVKLFGNIDSGCRTDIIYTGVSSFEEAEKANALIGGFSKGKYILAAFLTKDWNAELSPWEAKAAFGNENFSGKGKNTLSFLENDFIPYAEKDREINDRFIAGYSLSGLFSLWAFYESGLFSGAASCSGSLWFSGWTDYMKNRSAPRRGIIYMSLGSKEEKTKNRIMSSVGDNTRAAYEIIKNDKNIAESFFEENAGGHFCEPEKRTAKGIAWLLNNSEAALK